MIQLYGCIQPEGESLSQRVHIIADGNEKDGTGKSTIAMHIIVSLMNMGLRIGSIDLDARQATLTRYIENRQLFIIQQRLNLPVPTTHEAIVASDPYATGIALEEGLQCLDDCVRHMRVSPVMSSSLISLAVTITWPVWAIPTLISC